MPRPRKCQSTNSKALSDPLKSKSAFSPTSANKRNKGHRREQTHLVDYDSNCIDAFDENRPSAIMTKPFTFDEDGDDEDELRSDQQRSAANARERARMRVLAKAFSRLKTTLPWVPADTKLSKLDTLRLATSYIAHLQEVLSTDEDDEDEATPGGGGESSDRLARKLEKGGEHVALAALNEVEGQQMRKRQQRQEELVHDWRPPSYPCKCIESLLNLMLSYNNLHGLQN